MCPGMKSSLINFQLAMVLVKVKFFHPFFSLFISMTYSWNWKRKVLGVTGTSTSLVLFVMKTTLLFLLPPPSALRLMLSTCASLAATHYHAGKSQLIRFSCSRCSSDNSTSSFLFNGLSLQISHSVKNLGHILISNFSYRKSLSV